MRETTKQNKGNVATNGLDIFFGFGLLLLLLLSLNENSEPFHGGQRNPTERSVPLGSLQAWKEVCQSLRKILNARRIIKGPSKYFYVGFSVASLSLLEYYFNLSQNTDTCYFYLRNTVDNGAL